MPSLNAGFCTHQRPGLEDEFQQRAFKEVRGFFDAPMDLKKTAHISNTPYFRGYTLPTPADRGHGQSSRTFNSALKRTPSARTTTGQCLFTNDSSLAPTLGLRPMPPGFRPLIEDITHIYHSLTHELGELIVESSERIPLIFENILTRTSPILRPV